MNQLDDRDWIDARVVFESWDDREGPPPGETAPVRILQTARALGGGDVAAVASLARAMHEESPFESRAAFSAERVTEILDHILAHPSDHAAMVLERRAIADAIDPDAAGEVVGFIAGALTPYTFSYERFVAEIAFYVAPAQRITRGPELLLRALSDWAERKGAREVAVGIHTEHRAERIGQFLEHVGFRYIGGLYKRAV